MSGPRRDRVVRVTFLNRAAGGDGRALRAPGRAKVEKAFAAAVGLSGEVAKPRRRAGRPAGAKGRLSVEVVWVADREMRALKRRFTGRGGTTDVLAFEDADGQMVPENLCAKHREGRCGKRFLTPFPTRRRLGEIVCNLELAGREAVRYGHTREAEAVLYATHGLVHLLGGRDETPRGRREMRTVELGALRAAELRVRGGEWEETRQLQRITAKSAKLAKDGIRGGCL